MITIRALGHRELRQVLDLLARYSQDDFEYSSLETFRQLTIPFLQLSRCLPARHQFLPAIYVAVAHNKVLGLVWLSPDATHRWKLEQLIIDPAESTYDIGSQLVSYIMNRYGADGVQSFIAHVSEKDIAALGLLKTLGFRFCTRLHTFQRQQPIEHYVWEGLNGHQRIREYHRGDRTRLCQLFNDLLPPEVRVSLEKTTSDLDPNWLRRCQGRLQGHFFKRWVVEDLSRDVVIAAVEIGTTDYSQFRVSLLVSPVWLGIQERLLQFILGQVYQVSRQAVITTTVFDFAKELQGLWKSQGFEPVGSADVLVKDYWIPLQPDNPRHQSPVLLRQILPA